MRKDINLVTELSEKLLNLPVKPCFVVMLAFAEPQSTIPVKAFSFENSEVISRAYCDSSKPSRSTASERWVLHSTAEYAEDIIAQTGLKKPSDITFNKVAEQLFQEFQRTGLNISQPFFKKAHRCVACAVVTSVFFVASIESAAVSFHRLHREPPSSTSQAHVFFVASVASTAVASAAVEFAAVASVAVTSAVVASAFVAYAAVTK
ncbi:hypothetical protein Fmac_018903 [Flemingia macrophylla]|uniref:Uncharacterized protein n=1 Tax=Flemingia macrophylla TaxID=520843 RepID=A0ABD1M6P7_9FABA